MNRGHYIKMALLALLAFGSYLTSDSLMARKMSSQEASRFTKVLAVPDALLPSNAIKIKPAASFHMDEFDVESIQGQVVIDASATIQDTRPGRSYLWVVLARDQSTHDIIDNALYFDKVFTSESKNVEDETGFREVVPLNPGSYTIELRLYDVTTSPDIDLLNLIDYQNPYIMISNAKDVEVR